MENTTFYKKWLRIILGAFFIVITIIFALQEYGEYKITSTISEHLPSHVVLNYKSIDLNLFFNTIDFDDIKVEVSDTTNSNKKTKITASKLNIEGLEYWSLLKNERFVADNVYLHNAFLQQKNENTNQTNLYISNSNIEFKLFKTDAQIAEEKIPFKYDDVTLTLDSLSLDFTAFEILKIKALSYKNKVLETAAISMSSKYSRAELSQQLKTERDHVHFEIDNSISENFTLTTTNDSLLIAADLLKFNTTNLTLYRDKLLADNIDNKLLYGAMLRKLPVKLDLNIVVFNGQLISYTEKVSNDIKPTPITFKKWNARINNLSNFNTEKIRVTTSALLMGEAPIELRFSFNTTDPSNHFTATSTIKDLETASINSFLESNAKVRAKGKLQELYFTISGDNFKSSGDMKMRYEDFKFQILDKDRLGVNKTLTAIVNLFTNDGSKTDVNGYRYGDIQVERDKTKSFFNYLWLNTRNGLKNTVTGKGEKQNN